MTQITVFSRAGNAANVWAGMYRRWPANQPSPCPDGFQQVTPAFGSAQPVSGHPELAVIPVTITDYGSSGGCFTYYVSDGTSGSYHGIWVTLDIAGINGFAITPAQGGSTAFTYSEGASDSSPDGSVTYGAATVADSNFGLSGSSLTASATAPPGLYFVEFDVAASDINSEQQGGQGSGGFMTEVNVTAAAPPDFVISQPGAMTMAAGTQSTFSLTVVPQPGFAGTVLLGPSGVAGGPQISYSAASLTFGAGSGAQRVTATVNVPASVVTAGYSVPVVAVSGSLMHGVSVPVKVTGGVAPSFTVSAPDVQVRAGYSTGYRVLVTSTAGLTGTGQVVVQGIAGVSALVNPVFNGNAQSQVVTFNGVVSGPVTAQVTVSLGGISSTATFQVNTSLAGAAGFTLSWAGPTLVTAGQAVTGYVYVSPQSGYSGNHR